MAYCLRTSDLSCSQLGSRALCFLCIERQEGTGAERKGGWPHQCAVLRDPCKGPALSTRQEWWVSGYFCITHQCHSSEGSFGFVLRKILSYFFPLILIPVLPVRVRNVQVGRKIHVMWLCSLCKNYYLLLLTLPSSATKSVGRHNLKLFILEVD